MCVCVSVYNPIQIVFIFTASEVLAAREDATQAMGKQKGQWQILFFAPGKKKTGELWTWYRIVMFKGF